MSKEDSKKEQQPQKIKIKCKNTLRYNATKYPPLSVVEMDPSDYEKMKNSPHITTDLKWEPDEEPKLEGVGGGKILPLEPSQTLSPKK